MEEKRWNLSPIYPAVDSKEFNEDLAKLKKLLAGLKAKLESGNVQVRELVEMENEISDIEETLGSYAYCNVSVNTTDKTAVNALNKVDELSMDSAVCGTLFNTYVAEHKDQIDAFCKENPDYRFVFDEIAEDAKHQMPKELEELAADLMRSGSDAFGRLQETISSSACAELDGKKLTVIQLRALATNADRETRRKAYEAELKVWKEHEIAFCYALNSIKGTSLSLEKRRKWASPKDTRCPYRNT